MQNTCSYGNVAQAPFRISIPRKEPEEVKEPDIRSRTTQKFTDRDMEFAPTERANNYEVFKIEKKLRKKDKRKTCVAKGSVEYETQTRS